MCASTLAHMLLNNSLLPTQSGKEGSSKGESE